MDVADCSIGLGSEDGEIDWVLFCRVEFGRLAGIDALIERARGYGVAGLNAFVEELQRDWEASAPALEGRSDVSQDAIEIVTIHSAKALSGRSSFPLTPRRSSRHRISSCTGARMTLCTGW